MWEETLSRRKWRYVYDILTLKMRSAFTRLLGEVYPKVNNTPTQRVEPFFSNRPLAHAAHQFGLEESQPPKHDIHALLCDICRCIYFSIVLGILGIRKCKLGNS